MIDEPFSLIENRQKLPGRQARLSLPKRIKPQVFVYFSAWSRFYFNQLSYTVAEERLSIGFHQPPAP